MSNRDIKFRAWIKEDKEMCDVSEICLINGRIQLKKYESDTEYYPFFLMKMNMNLCNILDLKIKTVLRFMRGIL